MFDAIKAASARAMAIRTEAVFRKKGLTRRADEMREKADANGKELTRLLKVETISGDDVRGILAIE
jgi:hypothetical protein